MTTPQSLTRLVRAAFVMLLFAAIALGLSACSAASTQYYQQQMYLLQQQQAAARAAQIRQARVVRPRYITQLPAATYAPAIQLPWNGQPSQAQLLTQ